MNNPITSHPVILNRDYLLEDGRIIPAGTAGFIITKAYLDKSSFSPDDFDKLLQDAHHAESQGLLYVDFHTHGKCRPVHPNWVN